MVVYPQTREFLATLAGWTALDDGQASVQQLRDQLSGIPADGNPPLPHVAGALVGGVPVRVYRPAAAPHDPLPALVYLHGGAWVLGGLDDVDPLCRALAAEAGCAVFSVDYRLAPEHPFPAAVDDAWAVLRALVAEPARHGVDPAALAVGGDSAGGNLAAATALLARDHGVVLAHQLLVYPVTDTARDTPSHTEFGTGYGLDAAALTRFQEMYAGHADPADPLLAPLRAADLTGVAPATLITAGCDILRDEGEEYAVRLAAAGVPVTARRYHGVVHGFFLLPDVFDAGGRARALAVRRLRDAWPV